MTRAGALLLCLLVAAACGSPAARVPETTLPEEADLAPIPTYPPARNDWDTSAVCSVYPVFRSEDHPHSIGLVKALHAGLRKSGYRTVALPVEGYTALDRLTAVNRILRPSRLTFRQTLLARNRIAVDAHLLIEVWEPGDIEGRRMFEVWARDVASGGTYVDFGPLYRSLVANLLSLETFRGALELEPTRVEKTDD